MSLMISGNPFGVLNLMSL